MRCLWITRQDPRPSDSGELIYSRGVLRSLAAASDFQITVLAHRPPHPGDETDPELHWELHGWIPKKKLGCLLSSLPSDASRLGNKLMRAAFEALAQEGHWDWVIIDQAACGWALSHLPHRGGPRVAYIAHNHETSVRKEVASAQGSSPLIRTALEFDAWKYGRLEQAICDRADLITAITPRDQELFRRMAPEKPVIILSPGYQGPMVPTPPTISESTPRRVILAGAFEWLAKRRNLETFLAAAENPFRAANIHFVVAGKADATYFADLAKRHPWAEFHANVPSIDPYLTHTRVGLIPEALGGGFKLKALDYIFRGLPLAAIETALSGLPIEADTNTITAKDPASLAYAIAARIDNFDFLNTAAKCALDQCREAFRWPDRGAILAQALENLRPGSK